MADFLNHLVRRIVEPQAAVRPRPRSAFEPAFHERNDLPRSDATGDDARDARSLAAPGDGRGSGPAVASLAGPPRSAPTPEVGITETSHAFAPAPRQRRIAEASPMPAPSADRGAIHRDAETSAPAASPEAPASTSPRSPSMSIAPVRTALDDPNATGTWPGVREKAMADSHAVAERGERARGEALDAPTSVGMNETSRVQAAPRETPPTIAQRGAMPSPVPSLHAASDAETRRAARRDDEGSRPRGLLAVSPATRPRERDERDVASQRTHDGSPMVQVTIGRIEIRAAPPAAPPRRVAASAPTMSLREYLDRRNGRPL